MNLKNYIRTLDNNTNDTMRLAKSCSSIQLQFNEEGKWNIMQILEHIYIVDKVIYRLLLKPSDKLSETEDLLGDNKIKRLVVEKREYKVAAPESLYPKGDITDVATFEKLFLQQRTSIKHDLESGKIIIDTRIHKHPYLGEMTIADWLSLIIHHTHRHLEQIKDCMFALETNNS